MNGDSGFDNKEFTASPYLKLIKDKEGATCMCYQMRLHGKLHFVKKIKPEFENDSRMRAAFRKENEIGFSLSHPNIPRYLFMEGIFSPEEYVVTEWIEGTSLDKFIESNPEYFSKRKNIERFINQFADALDYLHNNGIIHGDLKPSNIMMTHDGARPMLLDFGYSLSDSHDLTGGFSKEFASPEVLGGESPNIYDDYYSFGKILGYIRKNVATRCFPIKIRKPINHLTTGDRRKKENAYNRLKNNNSESRRYLIPAIILIILFVNLALFVWYPFNENNEKEAGSDSISQERGFKGQAEMEEKENIEELNDGKTVPKIDLSEKIYKDSPNEQKAPESKDAGKNALVVKGSEIKEGNNNSVSPVNPNYLDMGVAPDLEKSVRLEVKRQLNNYYPPLMAKIDHLIQNEIYTKELDDSITRLYEKGIIKCLDILYYEKMFPRVSRVDLYEIVDDESQKYFKENTDKKFFEYRKRVKAMGK
ncbi:MAG: protein kinase [Muribaculaceae bacterium]|nr:protein kinase [Muribaculaceae bacterium]